MAFYNSPTDWPCGHLRCSSLSLYKSVFPQKRKNGGQISKFSRINHKGHEGAPRGRFTQNPKLTTDKTDNTDLHGSESCKSVLINGETFGSCLSDPRQQV